MFVSWVGYGFLPVNRWFASTAQSLRIQPMNDRKHLLIVAHNPSPNTQKLVEATLRGASHEDIDGVEVKHVAPLQAGADDVLWADAIILGTTENFGYMSGALKDFFDRSYYPCLEKTQGLPFALYIRAGMDGTGTRVAVTKITTVLRWRPIQDPVICRGTFQEQWFDQCEELGMTMAAGLESGIF